MKNGQVTGRVTYNGHGLEEFVPQKTSAYISQNDVHVGVMTVQETLDFSARCQGVGTRYGNYHFSYVSYNWNYQVKRSLVVICYRFVKWVGEEREGRRDLAGTGSGSLHEVHRSWKCQEQSHHRLHSQSNNFTLTYSAI